MIKREDIKGFTLNLFFCYLEVVYYKYFFNLKSISICKKLYNNGVYLLDRPLKEVA